MRLINKNNNRFLSFVRLKFLIKVDVIDYQVSKIISNSKYSFIGLKINLKSLIKFLDIIVLILDDFLWT